MAPATNDGFSAPGSATYDSNTMTVGDGTWDFSRNTFLLPNLQGVNFDTMRYNGMGNRFSTLTQYHRIVLAHAVIAALVFLLLIPFSVMTVRFYSRRPGTAVKYHAQINIVATILLLAVFILGFFAVGEQRSLTNPHHGIGVAIFVLFIVQFIGGRLVLRITKARSLRVTLHQWIGRAIALLGIVQVPLGLTLYGSPKYLFILYTVWMSFLLLLYFILSYRSTGRREFYMSGARSEATRTRVTESEYFASGRTDTTSGRSKWLGPLAAGAGVWALSRGRNKDKHSSRSRSPSPSVVPSRAQNVTPSRHGSSTYLTEKYSDLRPPKHGREGGGGGFMKVLLGIATAIGAGKLVSGLMEKREDRRRSEEYSAVSTETPRRHRPGRGAPTVSDLTSDYTEDPRPTGTRMETRTSLVPPSGNPAVQSVSALSGASSRPPPRRPMAARSTPNRVSTAYDYDESDYSSYVSPSRRPIEDPPRTGFAKGLMSGLGVAWFTKKMAERRARREEDQMRDEESSLRSGTEPSRYTGDGHPSPVRKGSRRPGIQRRPTGYARDTVVSSDVSSSVFEDRPPRFGPPTDVSSIPPVTPVQPQNGRSGSQLRHEVEHVSMPAMPPDPQGILAGTAVTESDGSNISPGSRPGRSTSARRRRAAERQAAVVAARSREQLGENDPPRRENRERYDSPSMSVKLKVHDDKDRNVTLRLLTEEEAMAARGRRDSDSGLSDLDSPSYGRRYRRDSSQRRAEQAAEKRAEEDDQLPALSPPNPAFAKGKRVKDSAYYSGQPGPSGSAPAPAPAPNPMTTVSSLGSLISPEQSHGTWSGMSHSVSPNAPTTTAPPTGQDTLAPAPSLSAADNRRRRREERRRTSGTAPSGLDMFD